MSAAAGNRGEVSVREPSRTQRTSGRRAAESRATIPDFEGRIEVELAPDSAPGPALSAAGLAACAAALREVPQLNGAYRDGIYEAYSRVNIGLVVPAQGGVAVATVFDADAKDVSELADEIAAARRRAQAGELTPPEQAGSTFSLWDFSDTSLGSATPIVVPGHAGAAAIGGLRSTAIVRDAAIVPGQVVTISLACDHRIAFGQDAAGFLAAVRTRLQALLA